ncbi:hypothetical protein [Stenotrophobium rhamnosiphilum]|uniref:Uncharacterized protein n=1 Tax=Stenotrophobium rhamnosiphilum TaxID=2029166 RepID=A0A2T5MFN9_9GAMM|nr:hypothetical protein [Stenotrophobium rhamnosiphilum]PTU31415.1 hypothetical protein CJD38_08725 [Stenotrophobium rhamnosiphilum]
MQNLTTQKLIAVLTLVGLLFAAYLYWSRAASPIEVEIKNATTVTVAVRLESDADNFYPVSMVVPASTAKTSTTGKDKSLKAIVLYADGQTKQSQTIDATKPGAVLVVVTSEAVELRYKP